MATAGAPAPPDLNINYHYHRHAGPGQDYLEALEKQTEEITKLRIGVNALAEAINSLEDKVALDLANLTTEITENTTVVGSAITLLQAIIAELQANSGNQAAVDALAADLSNTTDALAAAVASGTPAEPTP